MLTFELDRSANTRKEKNCIQKFRKSRAKFKSLLETSYHAALAVWIYLVPSSSCRFINFVVTELKKFRKNVKDACIE
jgi:hypothetical protein